ncbi:MAG: hypothetical protein WAO56_09415 [Miniphocaeibacter sp.]|uniref:Uncharacterized protein n=1 Tax=Miniphocaeibacter halophilus TaxID=2931922 RepID=A0AC61MW35_9FIRM|nr:hypothetical protein [Miniphocaeibacter halophilus]QQK08161.1 hypothetical protein JFY71_01095 [Miniphocaeibacter halophilus]
MNRKKLSKKEKRIIDRKGKELSLKNMYFNRYLIVRYTVAFFFFINVYWLISLFLTKSFMVILPCILILFLVFVIFEHVKLYSHHTNKLPRTKLYFKIQLFLNIILIILSWTNLFIKIFPILKITQKTRLLVSVGLLIGIIISYLIIKKLNIIEKNKDKQFERIKKYEKAIRK